MDVRVALVQTNPKLGNLSANLADHLVEIESARAAGAQMVLFPELSLSGYFLKDQTVELALARDARELAELARHSRALSIAVGFVERSSDGRLYNAMAFFEDGKLLHVHRKVHLVTYGMFDEQREFAAGDSFRAFQSKHGRFGMLVCEDAWHLSSGYQHFLANVDALLVHSNSPGRGIADGSVDLASKETWNTLLLSHAVFFQTWTVFVNRVGWEDGVLFSGGSCIFDPFGNQTGALTGFDPARLMGRLLSRDNDRARTATPLRRDAKPWVLSEGLSRIERENRGA